MDAGDGRSWTTISRLDGGARVAVRMRPRHPALEAGTKRARAMDRPAAL